MYEALKLVSYTMVSPENVHVSELLNTIIATATENAIKSLVTPYTQLPKQKALVYNPIGRTCHRHYSVRNAVIEFMFKYNYKPRIQLIQSQKRYIEHFRIM